MSEREQAIEACARAGGRAAEEMGMEGFAGQGDIDTAREIIDGTDKRTHRYFRAAVLAEAAKHPVLCTCNPAVVSMLCPVHAEATRRAVLAEAPILAPRQEAAPVMADAVASKGACPRCSAPIASKDKPAINGDPERCYWAAGQRSEAAYDGCARRAGKAIERMAGEVADLRATVENLRASHDFPRLQDIAEASDLRARLEAAEKERDDAEHNGHREMDTAGIPREESGRTFTAAERAMLLASRCRAAEQRAEKAEALVAEWVAKDGNSPGYNLEKARTYGRIAAEERVRAEKAEGDARAAIAALHDPRAAMEQVDVVQTIMKERDIAIADAARLASYLEAHNLGATSTFNDPPPDITGMRADWWRAGRKAARDAGELATAIAEREAAQGKALEEAAEFIESLNDLSEGRLWLAAQICALKGGAA